MSARMRAIVLAREHFLGVIDEAMPMIRRHWHEVAHYKDIPLQVDHAGYARCDALGMLRVYTARENGKLVGYAAYVVSKNSHYAGSPQQAKQDVIYVEPTRRGAFVGLRLVRFADEKMHAEGIQVVYHHVKLEHPALASVLRRAGYEPIETIWGKRLDLPSAHRQGEEPATHKTDLAAPTRELYDTEGRV